MDKKQKKPRLHSPGTTARAASRSKTTHCFECSQVCCRTTVIEVEAPRTLRDHSDLLFYLYHFDTEIAIADNDGQIEWYVEFMSPCRFLSGGRCMIYDHRPKVCREYDMETCEYNLPERFTYIRTPQEFFEHLARHGPKGVLKRLEKTHLPPGGYPTPKSRTRRTRINRHLKSR